MKFCNFCPPNGTNKCKPAGYNFDERVFKIMSNDFKKIARKIKRRRIIVSAIIILVTLVATTSVLNYKASQGNEEPFIALGTNYEFGDETTIKITTSLGFKHIKYESRYGKNYSECVPFWKSYDYSRGKW